MIHKISSFLLHQAFSPCNAIVWVFKKGNVLSKASWLVVFFVHTSEKFREMGSYFVTCCNPVLSRSRKCLWSFILSISNVSWILVQGKIAMHYWPFIETFFLLCNHGKLITKYGLLFLVQLACALAFIWKTFLNVQNKWLDRSVLFLSQQERKWM